MDELIERLERAEGPRFELDVAIWEAVAGEAGKDTRAPAYTASMDAAMTLVPEGWRVNSLSQHSGSWNASLVRSRKPGRPAHFVCSTTTTGALALCIAALRARGQQT